MWKQQDEPRSDLLLTRNRKSTSRIERASDDVDFAQNICGISCRNPLAKWVRRALLGVTVEDALHVWADGMRELASEAVGIGRAHMNVTTLCR